MSNTPNPPNFALLLSKRMDDKGGDEGSTPLGPPEGKEPDQHAAMESSAVSAFFDAYESKDVEAGKQALKDFIELCQQDYDDYDDGGPNAAA